jgi:hypothetical protein
MFRFYLASHQVARAGNIGGRQVKAVFAVQHAARYVALGSLLRNDCLA